MASLVAINLGSEKAVVVAAQTSAGGAISINKAIAIDLNEFDRTQEKAEVASSEVAGDASVEDSSSEQSTAAHAALNGNSKNNGSNGHSNFLQEALEIDYDASLATVQSGRVLFGHLKLPFNDPKKLEQTVPLQVQDFVPFELDPFLIGSWVIGQAEDGEYNVLSSLIPESDVSYALQRLKQLGSDPKLLTILPGSMVGLLTLCADVLNGTFALLVFSDSGCGIAIFVDDKLRWVRELDFTSLGSADAVYRELRCCIARVEYDSNLVINNVFAVTAEDLIPQLTEGLRQTVTHLDLRTYVEQSDDLGTDVNNLGWAVGLLAAESLGTPKNVPTLDYRLGNYAYKPAWGNFLAAIREQRLYLLAGLCGILIWAGTVFFTAHKDLSAVNNAISERINTVFPGEAVYTNQEMSFLDSRTEEVRNELNDLGSLAPLSPLQTLMELAKVIPPQLGVQIESLKIHEDLTITGSVPGYKEAGALKSSLESAEEKFCEITVDPTNKSAGANRVGFVAVIKYCN